jgi:hypothetical protein
MENKICKEGIKILLMNMLLEKKHTHVFKKSQFMLLYLGMR